MALIARAAITDMKIGIGVNYLRALNCESWLLRDQWKERLRSPLPHVPQERLGQPITGQ